MAAAQLDRAEAGLQLQRQVGAAFYIELAVNSCQVLFYGTYRHVELTRDLAVGVAVSRKPRDAPLSITETSSQVGVGCVVSKGVQPRAVGARKQRAPQRLDTALLGQMIGLIMHQMCSRIIAEGIMSFTQIGERES